MLPNIIADRKPSYSILNIYEIILSIASFIFSVYILTILRISADGASDSESPFRWSDWLGITLPGLRDRAANRAE